MLKNKIFEEILDFVLTLQIIDTHEHLPWCESVRDSNTDVLKEYLQGYFCSDLVSAGLSRRELQYVMDNNCPLMQRWDVVEPFWEAARYTGYGRVLDMSVQILYGINKICRSTIELLNDEFKKTLKPGHFKLVLKEKSNIKISILDCWLDCDKEFFRSVYRLDDFIYPKTMRDIYKIETEAGIRICSMDDWLEACEIVLEKALKSGAVALKSGLAYERTLKYERTAKFEAENCFNNILKLRHFPDWVEPALTVSKEFQDYMMHFILRLANRKNLTFQFHTGMHEGNGNLIYNSDPSLLSNLFVEYPDVDFDIFHIGYPYQNILSVLAKTFPNVYIDMCWAHIISPEASVKAMTEWFDSVPLNKISAFGGDNMFVDAICGHQQLARVNVSKALALKVEEGVFDIEKAKEIAYMLFYSNPLKILKLGDKI